MNSINPILSTSFNPLSLFSRTPQEKLDSLKIKKQNQRCKYLYAAFKLNQELKNIEEQIHWLNHAPHEYKSTVEQIYNSYFKTEKPY